MRPARQIPLALLLLAGAAWPAPAPDLDGDFDTDCDDLAVFSAGATPCSPRGRSTRGEP